MTDKRTHWESIYQAKKPDSVSWYQPSLRLSLEFISGTSLAKDAPIIDVGGGTSTLVDDLLSLGYSNVTVLDISAQGLDYSKARLGDRAKSVKWIVGDIARVDLSQLSFDLWHDRAAFHFLVDEQDRRKYCNALEGSLRPGGFAVIATFSPNGPLMCSGLQTAQYNASSLLLTLGSAFKLITSQAEIHTTPSGKPQEFVYSLLQRK
jgi:SAM-dependent methyltransferase